MTTLNTIIEEEKTTAEQLDEIALSRVTSINGVLVQMWDRNVLSAYIDGKLATSMQRAYETGLTDAYRVKEIVEDCGHQQEDGSIWMKRKEVIKKIDTHLDQLKKEIKG